ncbi:MAG TPA: hypothetical protein VM450_16380 [Thermomicrobiales bacterium]|jgi:hypothetical protein|nr:hypothetical protein [Thermomicrobiales bacterium]
MRRSTRAAKAGPEQPITPITHARPGGSRGSLIIPQCSPAAPGIVASLWTRASRSLAARLCGAALYVAVPSPLITLETAI